MFQIAHQTLQQNLRIDVTAVGNSGKSCSEWKEIS